MTYQQSYYKEIFLEALQNALNEGLISHSAQFIKYIENKQDISNFYAMILSIHSEVFEKVYSDMTEVYNSFKINESMQEISKDIYTETGAYEYNVHFNITSITDETIRGDVLL